MGKRVHNFNAGPAALPLAVLERARAELVDYQGKGLSVMEMSHRSAEFEAILESAERGVRKHLGAPENYEVLFLQGGGSLQFAMAPMNLAVAGKPVEVIHTGAWTQKAIEELERLAKSEPGRIAYKIAASTEGEKFRRLPRAEEIRLEAGASYVYLASNNTIEGTQWRKFPETGEVPLVADMSSDILSRAVEVGRFGMIFAGAQKNLGPSGVTVAVLRKDLAERAPKTLPAILQYRTHAKGKSLYHTPPTYAIHILDLVMQWIGDEGGIAAIEKRNEEKAKLLYGAIDGSGAFYRCPVEKTDRSRMNVVWRVGEGREDLEKQLVAQAETAGLIGLAGHRSVGGLRASLYNAVTVEAVGALVEFLEEFRKKS